MNRRKAWITLIVTVAIAWGGLTAMLLAGWAPKLGLDLQGGFAVTLVAPEGTDSATLETAADIMRLRIENLGGVQEPEVAVIGERAIVVQLPGVDDRERALQAVGTTGQLSFRPVIGEFLESPMINDADLVQPDGDDTIDPILEPLNAVDAVTGISLIDNIQLRSILRDSDELFVYEVGSVNVEFQEAATVEFPTGSDISDATAQFSSQGLSGQWVVVPQFTAEGGEKFRNATAYLSLYPAGDPRRQMAIVVDGSVSSAPAIAADVATGEGLDPEAVIITVGTGSGAQAEAESLAALLRYGALPTTFERERVESISASLGEDSLRAGLIAGMVGLLMVAAYMLFYYRSLGFISIAGLTVFGSYLLGSLILLGEFNGTTLTLAGVTGIVVSIGITSDSYIVYFERIKEEYHHGRGLRPAISHAYTAAFSTILKGDTVTLLAAVLLYMLAVGQVKGFALTLGIATVVDVGVSYFFTRPATYLLGRGPMGEGGTFSIEGAMGKHSVERPDDKVEVPV